MGREIPVIKSPNNVHFDATVDRELSFSVHVDICVIFFSWGVTIASCFGGLAMFVASGAQW